MFTRLFAFFGSLFNKKTTAEAPQSTTVSLVPAVQEVLQRELEPSVMSLEEEMAVAALSALLGDATKAMSSLITKDEQQCAKAMEEDYLVLWRKFIRVILSPWNESRKALRLECVDMAVRFIERADGTSRYAH